jgi:hypothetical protein
MKQLVKGLIVIDVLHILNLSQFDKCLSSSRHASEMESTIYLSQDYQAEKFAGEQLNEADLLEENGFYEGDEFHEYGEDPNFEVYADAEHNACYGQSLSTCLQEHVDSEGLRDEPEDEELKILIMDLMTECMQIAAEQGRIINEIESAESSDNESLSP